MVEKMIQSESVSDSPLSRTDKMAVFVATLFVTCLGVFFMTGGNALTGLATMPKVHSAPLEKGLMIPDQVVSELFSSFTSKSGDIQLLAKDVVDRLNQAKTVRYFHIYNTFSFN